MAGVCQLDRVMVVAAAFFTQVNPEGPQPGRG